MKFPYKKFAFAIDLLLCNIHLKLLTCVEHWRNKNMAKDMRILVCLLIIAMDIVAGVLGIEAEIAQNKVKSFADWSWNGSTITTILTTRCTLKSQMIQSFFSPNYIYIYSSHFQHRFLPFLLNLVTIQDYYFLLWKLDGRSK